MSGNSFPATSFQKTFSYDYIGSNGSIFIPVNCKGREIVLQVAPEDLFFIVFALQMVTHILDQINI